jgi:hypothetical protein
MLIGEKLFDHLDQEVPMSGNPYLGLDDEGELDEWDDEEDWYYRDGVRYRDDESPGETMARLAAEI